MWNLFTGAFSCFCCPHVWMHLFKVSLPAVKRLHVCIHDMKWNISSRLLSLCSLRTPWWPSAWRCWTCPTNTWKTQLLMSLLAVTPSTLAASSAPWYDLLCVFQGSAFVSSEAALHRRSQADLFYPVSRKNAQAACSLLIWKCYHADTINYEGKNHAWFTLSAFSLR